MKIKPFFISAIVALSISSFGFSQFNKKDYAQADTLIASFSDKILNKVFECKAIPKSNYFWYNVQTENGRELMIADAEKAKKFKAIDQEKLAKNLNKQLDSKIEPYKLSLGKIEFSPKLDTLRFVKNSYNWLYIPKKDLLIKKDEISERKRDSYWSSSRNELEKEPVSSPDKNWKAFIKNYNVFIKNDKDIEFQLSFDGSEGDFYSSHLKWSPDSKKLATNKIRDNKEHLIYFVESSPKDQLQPKLQKREYLKPGDALKIKRPALFDIEEKNQIPIEESGFLNQFSLTDPNWRADSRAFTFEFNGRGHQVYQVVEVNASNGKIIPLVNETSKTFIDYSSKKFRQDLNDGKEMIWASERDGWNHLYLFDNKGNIKNQITKGEWVMREVTKIDEKNRQIIFGASGINKDEDPYHIHYYAINFDGSGMKELTPENANHEITFSSDSTYMIDQFSRADMPTKTVLRKTSDGKILTELEQIDVSKLKETGWQMPEVFSSKGRDGETDIWGIIYRPTNFDPNKKYPVIEYIYAGPHSSHVPKSFIAYNSRMAAMAELGFITVQIDGMGTSNRSKAFHDVCWKNLKDAGFPDRIIWMKEAAKKYPYIDTNRVGIFGGSAGGQNAMGALLFHPEFYKVGVASCGCHDNRMDKIWWNEQWMGYPIGPEYAECSNVDNAHLLEGQLMLILGEVDDNVDPASTMQVADALIKANKEFELVILPGVNHTLGGDYGERKRRDFFVKYLLNEDTPEWN